MVDATTTLLRRVRHGERFYGANRSHAQKYSSRRHGSLRKVSMTVGAINLTWLLPLALAVGTGRFGELAGTLAAYAAACGACLLLHGKRPGEQAA